MFLLSLSATLIPLLFTILSASNMNGFSGPRVFHLKPVNVKFDVGFYQFAFGNTNTLAFASFNFCSDSYVSVELVDGYCAGDAFFTSDQGRPFFDTAACGTIGNGNCISYSELPSTALTNGNFCKGSGFARPGTHNITINAYNSPYTGGSAWITFRKYCFYYGQFIPCCQISDTCNFGIFEVI